MPTIYINKFTKQLSTLVLRSWLCSLLVSFAAYGRLLLDEDGSLSLSLSPNQEKGIQVGTEVMDSAGDRFPPDSSSNSAEPLDIRSVVRYRILLLWHQKRQKLQYFSASKPQLFSCYGNNPKINHPHICTKVITENVEIATEWYTSSVYFWN